MDEKEKGYIAKYVCKWCQKEFTHRARRSGVKSSNPDHQMKQVSNVVTCPFCKKNAKTWDGIVEVVRPLEVGE